MPTMERISLDLLHLDLHNYRTVHQADEVHAINTMISLSPDRFWALIESIVDDGYYPTENIILLKSNSHYIVKEGNRRTAALKIIHGRIRSIEIPEYIRKKIDGLSEEWKNANLNIPSTVYQSSELEIVEKIIALIHAKGEKAGREQWTAVAKARHSRDEKKKSEPGLDLLEKYLLNGKNLSGTQAERWSGDYPLSVLDETIQKLYSHLHYSSIVELVKQYPSKYKSVLDKIMYDIGIQLLGFKEIRDRANFFGDRYGISDDVFKEKKSSSQATPKSNAEKGSSSTRVKPNAQASTDPKSVSKKLRALHPKGDGREKIVTLINEMKLLKIETHPHSFCFLLRSIFEISAKAYCSDHQSAGGPTLVQKNGREKTLAVLLREITEYMTKKQTDTQKVKELHGAITEIAKPDGILSVTSMNQLVHNPNFSITPSDICILFANIYPLLVEMNS